jgi:hypothetical protein
MTLLVHAVWQKHRLYRSAEWEKQRTLALQVTSMSTLCLGFSTLLTIIYIVRLYGQSGWTNAVLPISFFLSYFAILLLPFVCLASLPELRNKVKRLDPRRWRAVEIAILKSSVHLQLKTYRFLVLF